MKIYLEYDISKYKLLSHEDDWNADVYDIGNNRALKKIHKNLNASSYEKFLNIFLFLKENPHRHIVKVYEVKGNPHNNTIYVTTEKLYKINYKYFSLITILLRKFYNDNMSMYDKNDFIKKYIGFLDLEQPNKKELSVIDNKILELKTAYDYILKYNLNIDKHLDIHGGNIMKDKKNVWKIIDF